jgi:uncharacterized membrane protein
MRACAIDSQLTAPRMSRSPDSTVLTADGWGTAHAMTFTEGIRHVAQAFEVVAAGVLALGLVWSVVLGCRTWAKAGGRRGYQALRESFGGVLLLGLEILVAADLIRTVAVTPTLRSVAVLGVIVLIRTFLSFSLQTEIEGAPPWRSALKTGGSMVAQAARKHTRQERSGDS